MYPGNAISNITWAAVSILALFVLPAVCLRDPVSLFITFACIFFFSKTEGTCAERVRSAHLIALNSALNWLTQSYAWSAVLEQTEVKLFYLASVKYIFCYIGLIWILINEAQLWYGTPAHLACNISIYWNINECRNLKTSILNFFCQLLV